MRNLRRLAWAVVAAGTVSSPASAQVGGNPGGNIGTPQTNPTATLTAPTTTSSSGGTNTTSTNTPQLATVEKAPQLVAPSTYANANSGGVVQSSNFLGPTYANPYVFGIMANTRSGAYTPTGFGNLTFGAVKGGATAGGVTAGVTATTGRGGAAGGVLATDPGGQLVALPRQIAYTAQLKFAPPPLPAPQLQSDLRGVIGRAGVPAGVDVQVAGNEVLLRGAVRDGDESRLVEGLVRLTPGVGRINNQLTYPR